MSPVIIQTGRARKRPLRRLRRLFRSIAGRWGAIWRDAMAAAVAAGLAWLLAQHLLDHPRPLFAAISAIVCLSPGLPSHFHQALGLLVGVAVGIVVGEFGLLIPDTMPLLRLALVAFAAIVTAGLFGLSPVVPIQAGVSAILVLTLGSATAGSVRMLRTPTCSRRWRSIPATPRPTPSCCGRSTGLSPASAPAPPIRTTSRRRSSPPAPTTASTWSPSLPKASSATAASR